MKLIKRCATFLLAALVLCAGLVPGLLSANEAGETITFYHHDHLGSPIMATNEAGAVLWIREYSAFGDPKTQGAAVAVGYAGHEYYPESNLTNMGARWYNSELGRFMSPDPVGFNAGNTLSFNRYLYGNNNPYTFYDPDGEYFDLALEFVSIGFGISSAINNIKEGNFGSAALDVVGIAVDVALAAVPGVPGGVGIIRQAAKNSDKVIGVANKTVGRWMSPDELAKMKKTGKVQEGGGGQTRVADPSNPSAYKAAPQGDKYVEFDVPANRLRTHSQGTGRIPGPNSPDARAAARKGRDTSGFEMPPATNIKEF